MRQLCRRRQMLGAVAHASSLVGDSAALPVVTILLPLKLSAASVARELTACPFCGQIPAIPRVFHQCDIPFVAQGGGDRIRS